jgi:hypothetical protein
LLTFPLLLLLLDSLLLLCHDDVGSTIRIKRGERSQLSTALLKALLLNVVL